ncbi:17579_t:CDS:2 [Dentiscutata erythropus]|uniref:17579_t:CDS:1 n=1 Tax=Dentiscutata erythropus TaxID=1348616 RepID=A0A9N9B1F8_9GLOM|nr:17579_t:CDS:2 [Dentiscutata erythropus]
MSTDEFFSKFDDVLFGSTRFFFEIVRLKERARHVLSGTVDTRTCILNQKTKPEILRPRKGPIFQPTLLSTKRLSPCRQLVLTLNDDQLDYLSDIKSKDIIEIYPPPPHLQKDSLQKDSQKHSYENSLLTKTLP